MICAQETKQSFVALDIYLSSQGCSLLFQLVLYSCLCLSESSKTSLRFLITGIYICTYSSTESSEIQNGFFKISASYSLHRHCSTLGNSMQ